MKRLYTLLLLLTFSIPVLSQELNFNDLVYLYTNIDDLDKCDSYLAKKNFIFMEKSDESLIFSYKRGKNKKAEAFIFINRATIVLQSNKRTTFDYYKQMVKTLGLKLSNSGTTEQGALYFDYYSQKYFVLLTQVLDPVDSEATLYLINFSMSFVE